MALSTFKCFIKAQKKLFVFLAILSQNFCEATKIIISRRCCCCELKKWMKNVMDVKVIAIDKRVVGTYNCYW